MSPTYQSGDRVLVFRWGKVQPGDIIVFSKHGFTMVKRVTQKIGERLIVRGDNISQSTDSLDFGEISVTDVVGRVMRRF